MGNVWNTHNLWHHENKENEDKQRPKQEIWIGGTGLLIIWDKLDKSVVRLLRGREKDMKYSKTVQSHWIMH